MVAGLVSGANIVSADSEHLPGYTTEPHSGAGRPDWVVTSSATKYIHQPLVIIFEFKRVTSESDDSASGPLKQARAGLEQVVSKGYATAYGGYHRHLDIGVAIGMGKVEMRQRLWTRIGGTQMAATNRTFNDGDLNKKPTETLVAWDLRVASTDNIGWHDGLGWKTKRLEQEYCQLPTI